MILIVTKNGPGSVSIEQVRSRSYGLREYPTMHNFFIPTHSYSVNDNIKKISTERFLGISERNVTMGMLLTHLIGR